MKGVLHQEIGWMRATAVALAILFAVYVAAACWTIYSSSAVVDFVSFWSAGKLALSADPTLAYDIEAHRSVEQSIIRFDGLLPFPYPPTFLLFVTPFALAPYRLSFALWVGSTGLLYLLSGRRSAPLPYSMAQPQVISNAAIGQNGFLTSAFFIGGTSLLSERPFAGGAILGLLVIKPQLAVVIPMALLAAREWKAIGGGMFSVVAINLTALLLFGPASFKAFFNILPVYAQWLASERWPWQEIATSFAFLRYFGVSPIIAWSVHGAVALTAVTLVWRHWAAASDRRVPILAAATVLVPPYLLTYDALLLVVPLTWLMLNGGRPLEVALIWILCLIPVAIHFGDFNAPNTISLAAVLALWAVSRVRSHYDGLETV